MTAQTTVDPVAEAEAQYNAIQDDLSRAQARLASLARAASGPNADLALLEADRAHLQALTAAGEDVGQELLEVRRKLVEARLAAEDRDSTRAIAQGKVDELVVLHS